MDITITPPAIRRAYLEFAVVIPDVEVEVDSAIGPLARALGHDRSPRRIELNISGRKCERNLGKGQVVPARVKEWR